jgi:hypothetical protein
MTKCNASSSKNGLDIKATFVTRDGKINLLKDHSTVTQELLCQAIPRFLFDDPEKGGRMFRTGTNLPFSSSRGRTSPLNLHLNLHIYARTPLEYQT